MKAVFGRGPQVGFKTFVLILLSVMMMFLDYRGLYIHSLRKTLESATYPIIYTVDLPAKWWHKIQDSMASHEALRDENQALRAKAILLKLRVQKLLALEAENRELRALLDSASYIKNDVKVVRIISIPSNPTIQEIVINSGKKNHTYLNQPVVDASGVMGQVISIGSLASHVMLITDRRSAIPVENTRNGVRAIAHGDGNVATLHLANVPKTSDIKEGDVFVTSGLGGVYPQGYPVGEVQQVKNAPGAQFAMIVLSPLAKLDRSLQVLLLWPQQGEVI